MIIPQLVPTTSAKSQELIDEMFENPSLFNSNTYSSRCENWLSKNVFKSKPTFLTTSGTRALELIAASLDLCADDEVIFPSYTFVGTANPFVLFGAKPVFVDVMEDTLGMDFNILEDAITENTKAIVVVHYNGIGAHIGQILRIAQKHNILLIEDNAQGFMCTYKNQFLGTFGDFSILSFNYTKNIQCGEGGALIVNNLAFVQKVEQLYHLGTNRLDFLNKKVDHYEWVSKGSKFYPSQLEAAVLLPQLEQSDSILNRRKQMWDLYYDLLSDSPAILSRISLPKQLPFCRHTGHIFYILLKNIKDKVPLISFLKKQGISAFSHYSALHLSAYGQKHGLVYGGKVAEELGESLIRLPIFDTITEEAVEYVVKTLEAFIKR